MAYTYEGYDGTVLEAGIARIIDGMPGQGTVNDAASWVVSAVAGNRRVSVAAGTGTDAFVRVTTDVAALVDIPTPTTAGRWYLIVARRDWSANSLSFVCLGGQTTTAITPAVLGDNGSSPNRNIALSPYQWPTMQNTAGGKKDQPLAWVHANNTNNTLIVVDVRRDKNFGRRMGLNTLMTEEREFLGTTYVTNDGAFKTVFETTVTFTDPRAIELRIDGQWRSSGQAAGYQVMMVNGKEVTVRKRQHNRGAPALSFALFAKVFLPAGGNIITLRATADSSGATRGFEYMNLTLTEA